MCTHFSPEPLDGQVGNMAGSFGAGLSLQSEMKVDELLLFSPHLNDPVIKQPISTHEK
jgi:hypothetical protein